MSCTIAIAIPYLLISQLVNLAVTAGVVEAASSIKSKNMVNDVDEQILQKVQHMEFGKAIEKLLVQENQTNFLDQDILVKTLQEHGVNNLKIIDDTVTCQIEKFNLKFFKNKEGPYILQVTHPETCNAQETIINIYGEYTKNVQECTYLKIKERLENENLQVDEEEILEDESIVLTINLD